MKTQAAAPLVLQETRDEIRCWRHRQDGRVFSPHTSLGPALYQAESSINHQDFTAGHKQTSILIESGERLHFGKWLTRLNHGARRRRKRQLIMNVQVGRRVGLVKVL